jgi:hypothetical protein
MASWLHGGSAGGRGQGSSVFSRTEYIQSKGALSLLTSASHNRGPPHHLHHESCEPDCSSDALTYSPFAIKYSVSRRRKALRPTHSLSQTKQTCRLPLVIATFMRRLPKHVGVGNMTCCSRTGSECEKLLTCLPGNRPHPPRCYEPC